MLHWRQTIKINRQNPPSSNSPCQLYFFSRYHYLVTPSCLLLYLSLPLSVKAPMRTRAFYSLHSLTLHQSACHTLCADVLLNKDARCRGENMAFGILDFQLGQLWNFQTLLASVFSSVEIVVFNRQAQL